MQEDQVGSLAVPFVIDGKVLEEFDQASASFRR